jgi:hypothetical protein
VRPLEPAGNAEIALEKIAPGLDFDAIAWRWGFLREFETDFRAIQNIDFRQFERRRKK